MEHDITPGSGIGISFGTSLTEAITQSALGLKHGGHERVLDESGILRAPKSCKLREEGRWIILETRGEELKYPRPDNIVFAGKSKFSAGDVIGTAYSDRKSVV